MTMQKAQTTQLRGDFFTDYELARYTSWRVGGKAERCYRPADLQDLQNFLATLPTDEPLTWLGLGSNVLIRDGGISGTVILTLQRLNQIRLIDETTVSVAAGVTCAKLAKFCVQHGFEDGAFFAGIPGTVGGALAMNAGAFGSETWRHVSSVETISHQGKITKRSPREFTVNYRQVDMPANEYFINGIFSFTPGSPQLAKQNISQLLGQRNSSQPIGQYSCGSVFRNPPKQYAAALIEGCNLKGATIGGAQVSTKHANFIINSGHATAHDIEALIEQVQTAVNLKYGIQLEREVHIIGHAS